MIPPKKWSHKNLDHTVIINFLYLFFRLEFGGVVWCKERVMGTNVALRGCCVVVLIAITIVFGVGYNVYQQAFLPEEQIILVKRESILKRDTTDDQYDDYRSSTLRLNNHHFMSHQNKMSHNQMSHQHLAMSAVHQKLIKTMVYEQKNYFILENYFLKEGQEITEYKFQNQNPYFTSGKTRKSVSVHVFFNKVEKLSILKHSNCLSFLYENNF